MNKYASIAIAAAVLTAASVPAAAKYVRKQLEPAFFMPESAKTQAEKLPMPRYLYGEEETIKAAKPEREPQRLPVVTENEEYLEDDVADDTDIPDYQRKYEDYSRDLEHISRTGEIPDNAALEEDLEQMNSDERQLIEKKPYQPRNSKAKFDKALNQVLF